MSAYETSVLDSAKATQMLKEILQLGKSGPTSNVTMDLLDRSASSSNGKLETKASTLLESGQNDGIHEGPNATKQELILNGSDENVSFSIYGNDVTIKCSRSAHLSGSSKVKIRNIVNSGWENKYYIGQQVATHISKNYIAYAVKLPSSRDGVVRVIGRRNQGRVLLRGMNGLVIDLAFAHNHNEVVLASVDEYGNAFVHSIKEDGENLIGTLIFELRQPEHQRASSYHRVIWCPYIPDDLTPDDDVEPSSHDISKLLVLAHDNVAEMWSLETVIKNYGAGPHTRENISVGFQQIKEHTLPISDAAVPPDGTALATVGYDGSIKFFEAPTVLDSKKPQKCIHKWDPHNEKPLSCLFFLDNLKNPNLQLQYWKFAITGANKNRELKVWNCSTWECLQTIRFETSDEDSPKSEFKARLDESAEFLILSDVVHRVIYILQLFQDPDNNIAQVTSISEFHLTYPVLSFDILEIGRKKFKQSPDIYNVEESTLGENIQVETDDDRKEIENIDGVLVKLISIQPKSLQECYIAFQPASAISDSGETVSSMSHDTSSFKDRLSDVSFETMSSDAPSAVEVFTHSKSLGSSQKLNLSGQILLTPEVFSSPSHDSSTKNDLALRFSSPKSTNKETEQNLMSLEEPSSPMLDVDSRSLSYSRSNGCHPSSMYSPTSDKNVGSIQKPLQSTGSSPSLEVQEILTKSLDDNVKDPLFLVEEERKVSGEFSNENSGDIINTIIGLEASMRANVRQENVTSSSKPISPLSTKLLEDHSPQSSKLAKWPVGPKVSLHSGQIIADDRKERKNSNVSVGSDTSNDLWAVKKTTTQLDMLIQSVQNLSLMIENQHVEMVQLKQATAKLESQVGNLALTFPSGKIQNDVNSSIKALLHKHRQSENTTLTTLFKNHEERLMSVISQVVNNSIVTRIDASIKAEFKNSIIPVFTRELENMQTKLHTEVVHQLASTDSLMKENIGKLVESKTFLSGVSHAISGSLQGVVRSIFQDVIQVTAVPLFEKLCQNMFQQINDSFQKGTNEYVHYLESCLEKQYTHEQNFMTSQLQTVVENVHLNADQSSTLAVDKLDKRLHSTLQRFEEQLKTTLCSLVKDEMALVIKEHKSVIGDTVVNAIKSRAVTPIPNVDPHAHQAHILHLIQQGQFNSAFQQALSAADLSLVTMVCEKVSPAQIFNQTPCPLQQPVLLSLIHQLCVDLDSHTELKQEYLQEAIVNLDFNNPITINHAPSVIDTFQQKLQQFIEAHPSNKLTRNMRVLLMAAQSLPRS